MQELAFIFNRALKQVFCKYKLALTSVILACCGLFFVFCLALASSTGTWVAMSLIFLPYFLCSGALMGVGVILIRIYHHEVKGLKVNYFETIRKSWDLVMGVSYYTIATILSYLLLWVALGIFLLLKEIPGLGSFFGVVLSFAPFMLNLGAVLLAVFHLLALFYLSPPLAVRGLNKLDLRKTVVYRLSQDIFTNGFLAFLGSLPLAVMLGLLTVAGMITGKVYFSPATTLQAALETFFMMIPFAALLSPSVVFFFHFAIESYSVMMKRLQNPLQEM